MKKGLLYFVLILIVVSGGFLRFFNLNWDENNMYHPDERNIANAVAKINFFNNLNPEFFAYNGFPIYLYKSIGYLLTLKENNYPFSTLLAALYSQKELSFLNINSGWTRDWSKINLIGRFISALSSTLSIYLIFLIGKNLIGEIGGLISAFIFAFTPSFIQQAHFGVTESLLVFFLLLLSLLAIKILEEKKSIYWIYSGIISGLAIASKIPALSFLIIPFLTWLISLLQEKKFLKYIALGFSFLIFTCLFFFIFSPYTIFDFQKFKESMVYESGVVTGRLKVPYNWQFFGTLPYVFQWINLHWQTNIFLPTLGTLGLIFWLAKALAGREKIFALPLLIFAFLYFLYVGSWYTKFIRYTLPFIPFLILASVWLLLKIIQFHNTKILGVFLLILVIFSSFLWGLAFFSIYTRRHTRLSASEWIYQNVPQNSVLLHEHWDDRLPGYIPGYDSSQYIYLEMKNYDPDTPEKISEMSENLAKGDFLIISSRRLFGSIGKNPHEWPITSKYYEKLFQGKFGYTLVQKITSYPKLLNFEIKDDLAEETFQVYDHPVVMIFKNEKRLSKETIEKVLLHE